MTHLSIKTFVVPFIDDIVGAIIDRPARKYYVFALVSGEFVTFYRAGDY